MTVMPDMPPDLEVLVNQLTAEELRILVHNLYGALEGQDRRFANDLLRVLLDEAERRRR